MIGIIVALAILIVVVWIVYSLINFIPMPAPLRTILYAILALIVLLEVLDFFGLYHMRM